MSGPDFTLDDIGASQGGRYAVKVGQLRRTTGVRLEVPRAGVTLDAAAARHIATLLNEAADCDEAGCVRIELDAPLPAVVSPAGAM